jgi:release factor glutamine methyltransferase
VRVLETIQRSTEFLAGKGVESPRLQVELLLAHVLRVPRLKLYLDFERVLTESELDLARAYVKRRAGREPLQHILGSCSFCGLKLGVSRDVLIPRPETEVLAERGWLFLRERAQGGGPASALDFGTGSGCLAIALASHVPGAQIHALDVSAAALRVAAQNAARHQLLNQITFFESHGFDAMPADQRYDLIVANPPYIRTDELAHLMPEVRDYDPQLALDGGPDGSHFHRLLAAEGPRFMAAGARLMCEFGDGQTEAVQQIFREAGWVAEAIENDLSKRPRILVASRRDC